MRAAPSRLCLLDSLSSAGYLLDAIAARSEPPYRLADRGQVVVGGAPRSIASFSGLSETGRRKGLHGVARGPRSALDDVGAGSDDASAGKHGAARMRYHAAERRVQQRRCAPPTCFCGDALRFAST